MGSTLLELHGNLLFRLLIVTPWAAASVCPDERVPSPWPLH